MTNTELETLTPEQLDRLVPLLSDVSCAIELLSPEDQAVCQQAHESVINSRRIAESRAGGLRLP